LVGIDAGFLLRIPDFAGGSLESDPAARTGAVTPAANIVAAKTAKTPD